jgi:hypothetical protein
MSARKNSRPGLKSMTVPWKRAAESAEQLVAPFRRFPFDRVAAERARNAHRAGDLPPDFQHVVVEKRLQHSAGGALITRL